MLVLQDSIKNLTSKINSLEIKLIEEKEDLAVAKDKMNSKKEFHFLRSQTQREQGIKTKLLL